MNYRVEAFFDDSKLSASEVSLICVFDKTEYEKFQDLSDDEKERYMKKMEGFLIAILRLTILEKA